MNEQKIRSEWKKFEDGFGAYVYDVRKMRSTIKWVGDTPDMMKDILKDEIKEAKSDIDKCIDAIDRILNEI